MAKAPSKAYYRLLTHPAEPTGRIVRKYNGDLQMESQYNMMFVPSKSEGFWDCACPASKFDCRHKAIRKSIEDAGELDGRKFFCFEDGSFKTAEEL